MSAISYGFPDPSMSSFPAVLTSASVQMSTAHSEVLFGLKRWLSRYEHRIALAEDKSDSWPPGWVAHKRLHGSDATFWTPEHLYTHLHAPTQTHINIEWQRKRILLTQLKKKIILYDLGTVFLSGLSYIPCVLVVKGQYVSVKYASLHISVRGFLIQQLALCILFQIPFNLQKYDWQIGTYLRCTMWYFYTRFATISTIKLVSISMTPYAHLVL